MSFFADRRPDPSDADDDFLDEFDDFADSQARLLGGVVPLELLIARSDTAAFAVRSITAYPDGFEFTLAAWVRNVRRPRRRARFHQSILLTPFDMDEEGQFPAELLRFGIQFPDGASVTNIDETPWDISPDATEPQHGMESQSGGGSDDHYEQEWWVWPLPTAGTLAFVGEWPAYDIPETRVEIDASLIIDAAARSVPVWPDLADGASHTTRANFFGSSRARLLMRRDEDDAEDR